MRYIHKNPLNKALEKILAEALKKNIAWDQFKEGRKLLRQHLKDEQFGLCAYSEISLSEYGFHIEHIKPKSSYNTLRFEHHNLLASAPENQADVDKSGLFGGHKKASNYDENLFISPTENNCQRYFQYSPNGDIAPNNNLSTADTERAKYTIECLGLQSSRLLKNKRRKFYEFFHSQIKYLLDQPDILEFYREDYARMNEDGEIKPFQSLVDQILDESSKG